MAASARPEPDEIERSADPRGAALVVERVTNARAGAAERLEVDRALRSALVTVGVASPWLARVCVADDMALDVLSDLNTRLALDPAALRSLGDGEPGTLLARAKRLAVLRIAARDLLGIDDLETVGANLADLAGSLLSLACVLTGSADRVSVIGMGKLGGRELNYSSDVDVMLVAGSGNELPEVRTMLDAAREAWRIDLDLRPEGRVGPLVRTLDSYAAYWDRWAQTWEFQALIKARAVAGNGALGERFIEEASSRIWARPFGAADLSDVRNLKERAEAAVVRRGLEDRELKRGRGGIRDIEFAVQLLQLVHGRSDRSLRSPSTLPALRALADGGYVGRDDAAALQEAYIFLRAVEHRLQLHEDQQTHVLPQSTAARHRLARVLGYRDSSSTTASVAFDADLRRHQATVRGIHERLFFRPLLEAFTEGAGHRTAGEATATETAAESGAADGPGQPAGLQPHAVEQRLEAFGFADAARTSTAVRELTRGFSRTSRLMQRMLPVLLDWLSESPDPDLGLLGLRSLAAAPRAQGELTALCRESPEAARQLCLLLGTGPRFARGFQHHPEELTALANRELLAPSNRDQMTSRLRKSIAWRSGESALEQGLRVFARSETLRIAARDVLGAADVVATGEALSDLAEVVISAALESAAAEVPLAVVGMGRLGGRELSYTSDLDLLFVYDSSRGGLVDGGVAVAAEVAEAAERATASVVRVIAGATPASGIYRVDTALRPEGRQGPQSRSLDAYGAYYRRWAEPWEKQALLRGRIVAGDPEVGERYAEIAKSFVWGRPFGADEIREIRRTKARVERERVPPSEDPAFHLKLGPGALADVEWTVQLLQLQHRVVAPGTMEALTQLTSAGAVSVSDAKVLSAAYRFCEQARNRLALVRDLPGDSLPSTGHVLGVLARSLGRTPTGLRDEYRRHTRRARRVVERLFYGGAPAS
ncbi:MAG TPA: bifunctional [glutamine synthetase] adenylyltransferase/[glutamine synthetase]-adenylyl-L-tyrosine phosphorylase [Acidimicrobiales bacterium]|nr:bifunctional [glutamine synthetase] adenylyltransferase/[glutamine synthetase]-adenylyl-L-tyrosine phosphorylase [Acidimicrobiales bacterium]